MFYYPVAPQTLHRKICSSPVHTVIDRSIPSRKIRWTDNIKKRSECEHSLRFMVRLKELESPALWRTHPAICPTPSTDAYSYIARASSRVQGRSVSLSVFSVTLLISMSGFISFSLFSKDGFYPSLFCRYLLISHSIKTIQSVMQKVS